MPCLSARTPFSLNTVKIQLASFNSVLCWKSGLRVCWHRLASVVVCLDGWIHCAGANAFAGICFAALDQREFVLCSAAHVWACLRLATKTLCWAWSGYVNFELSFVWLCNFLAWLLGHSSSYRSGYGNGCKGGTCSPPQSPPKPPGSQTWYLHHVQIFRFLLMPVLADADARARVNLQILRRGGAMCMQTAPKWQCNNTGNGKRCRWLEILADSSTEKHIISPKRLSSKVMPQASLMMQ